MKRLRYLLSVLIVALSLTATAQTHVTSFEPGVNAEGAVYFLPKTAIDVIITVEKITTTPGDLCKYADRYMRLTNVPDAEETHYELQSITTAYAGIADENKAFHIRFSTKSIAPNVLLSSDGTLLAINTDNPYSEEADLAETRIVEGEAIDATPYMTEDMLAAGSKARLADLVAREIYDIRDSKSSLLRGESDYMPADGEGLKLMVNNLQRQEDALMQLFSGVTIREKITRIYRFVPVGNTSKAVVARFSRKLGLLDTDDLAGNPLFIDVRSLSTQNAAVTAEDGINTGEEILPDQQAAFRKSKSYEGVMYNIPAKATVKVYNTNKVFVDEKTSLAQFGSLETLSSKLFSSKATTKVILDPVTGALVKIEE